MLPTDQFIRIASAGGGLKISAKNYMTDQLIRIASAASTGGGQIILVDINNLLTDQLIRIAGAGKGRVVFDFTA